MSEGRVTGKCENVTVIDSSIQGELFLEIKKGVTSGEIGIALSRLMSRSKTEAAVKGQKAAPLTPE